MADHLRAELAIDALAMAARNYPLTEGAIFHSDRGTQYTSAAFAAAANLLGIRQSVGASGVCFDNALADATGYPLPPPPFLRQTNTPRATNVPLRPSTTINTINNVTP